MKNPIQDSKFKIGLILFALGFFVFSLHLFFPKCAKYEFQSYRKPNALFCQFSLFLDIFFLYGEKAFDFSQSTP